MELYPTQPIQPAGDPFREKKSLPQPIGLPIDSKIKGLVLARIGETTGDGRTALLPSATAPRIMINLLAALTLHDAKEEAIELMPSSRQGKKPNLRKALGRGIPIGLRRCEPHGWINAWMQFLLYLPNLSELFSFAPRSFEPFREFADQYFFDQQENRAVSLANGASLLKCLLKTLPFSLFKIGSRIDLYDVLRAFFKAVFPHAPYCETVALHPEWHLLCNAGGTHPFEEEVHRLISKRPPEILVAIRGGEIAMQCSVKRQFFTRPDWHCYDLDAFIEKRPDEKSSASFAAYMKVDGIWYQCDDDRVCALRSTTLSVPLQRSALLHYKRIEIGK